MAERKKSNLQSLRELTDDLNGLKTAPVSEDQEGLKKELVALKHELKDMLAEFKIVIEECALLRSECESLRNKAENLKSIKSGE